MGSRWWVEGSRRLAVGGGWRAVGGGQSEVFTRVHQSTPGTHSLDIIPPSLDNIS